MKTFALFSALFFVAFCEGLPIPTTPVPTTPVLKPVPVSSKKVETFIDNIANSLTLEHTNALKLVKAQQTISLLKKQKLDVISEKLSNITGTYTQLQKDRQKSLTDYTSYMAEFKQVQDLIDRNKMDYDTEMKFLAEIKAYIKKVREIKCK
jgi:transcription antitermination factor NusG